MDSKRRGGWWVLAGMIIAMPILYVGAYFATAGEPVIAINGISTGPPEPRQPRYPVEWMASLFAAIHQIDRNWIRPGVWHR